MGEILAGCVGWTAVGWLALLPFAADIRTPGQALAFIFWPVVLVGIIVLIAWDDDGYWVGDLYRSHVSRHA